MKKSLLKLLSLSSILAISFTASSQNLVNNGDFEAAFVGTTTTKIPNWLVDYAPDFLAVTGSAAITSQSIRINSKNAKYLTSDEINVIAGHTYKLTFTGRVQDIAGDSGTGTAVGSITAIVMDGVVNGNLTSQFTPLVITSNSNTTLDGNYTAPLTGNGSTSVRLRFTRAASTNAYSGFIDNVSFEDLGVLPVTLTSFTGGVSNNGVTLNWITASEHNNDRFTVYSSANGKDFAPIGTVKGSGNAATSKSYTFVDRNPAGGANYYKLSQTDFDGKTTVFNPIAVNFNLAVKNYVSVYAEQNKLQGQVSWLENERVTLAVRNLGGQTVISKVLTLQNGNNSFSLDNADLVPSAIYLLTVTGSKNSTSAKFYVNNH